MAKKTVRKSRRKEQRLIRHWKLIVVGISVVGVMAIALLDQLIFHEPMHFGISVPKGFHTHGIDISQYQGDINWKKVSTPQDRDISISFVYMRATMGMRTDKKFKYNWQEAKRYGLKRGAYLYFHPNKDGIKQAELYIKRVGILNDCLAPVVDIEHTYKTDKITLRNNLEACLNRLQEHYGVQPVIYTYTTFYRDFLGSAFDNYPLWIAHYEREDGPDYIERPWDIWQYSERGRIEGITEHVDFNVLHCENDGIMPCFVCKRNS
ncbi:glycoside hydrolase family 25 protein [Olivibacter sp. SDN3]|uniref:glycoside hydrolase family 25 protein n=1 Tax=Olivibacter sp. SDN3 TaxID=2764720 RepID=UPI0016516B0E|nr:GH25 family lysozyme [Olivibacter sp. SDN3]QNL48604.1 glycoside hydrolase family 25 protein [Olivibacter sp. SDN3]